MLFSSVAYLFMHEKSLQVHSNRSPYYKERNKQKLPGSLYYLLVWLCDPVLALCIIHSSQLVWLPQKGKRFAESITKRCCNDHQDVKSDLYNRRHSYCGWGCIFLKFIVREGWPLAIKWARWPIRAHLAFLFLNKPLKGIGARRVFWYMNNNTFLKQVMKI